MSRFQEVYDFSDDEVDEYARKFLADPYKAPEVQKMAQEHLDGLKG